ncbi:MAG TPA: PIG-L family deacetylase [Rhodothermales bacterium]|nr:PIG-L family deacetylase [Rhodothermales bacterium]
MKAATVLLTAALCLITFSTSSAQPSDDGKLRIIAFGAHPDDCELKASGVAALWAKQGHHVKFVSMTNGDIGHFSQAGGPLAQRRTAEVKQCAKELGIVTDVLDIHDGELMPTLENRKKVARLIRDWQADIVLFPRPYDYHPDHRYTGVLVQDAAVVVAAPFFVPDTPPTPRNPIFLYYSDGFKRPYPFDPTIVVGIDDVADLKWACIRDMPSQFADKDSWQARTLPNVPEGDQARADYILSVIQRRDAGVADRYRDRLIELYGPEKGRSIKYAEAFELCQYGSQPTIEVLKKLFPTFE